MPVGASQVERDSAAVALVERGHRPDCVDAPSAPVVVVTHHSRRRTTRCTVRRVPIAITDDHLALADIAADLLRRRNARGANRALLEAEEEHLPAFWNEMAELGWLGLHLPEAHGGSGFGLPELVVLIEELGAHIAPGPFVPTVIASGFLAAAAPADLQLRLIPGLADGSLTAGLALAGSLSCREGHASGDPGVVLAGALADVVLAVSGHDVVVFDRHGAGVSVTVPANLDPARRSSTMALDGAAVDVVVGAGQILLDLARTLLAAEATGIARECTRMAAEHATSRIQFGRPIATFQAVKHHCANMAVATELATAAVWDASRAAASGGTQFSFAAAVAATQATKAADLAANLNIQVHGGIGFTWEHDAHLYLRRATAIAAVVDSEAAAVQVALLARQKVRRERSVELPPEADAIRAEVQAFCERVRGLDPDEQRSALINEGYAMPHWPEPWGRNASAVEQLVIEQEFADAGLKRPYYDVTGWVISTLIQHGTEDQVNRWVRPALQQELIWCQLFSEPDAGSDAAGITTKARRVEGGWLVNGQKVWTTGAHLARWGFATVRTNPDAAKHRGITMMVIDMKGSGVTVRPLRQTTGSAEFNEVFLDDVFVPDDNVVGPVDDGWNVARATLGNESVSMGGSGEVGFTMPAETAWSLHDRHPGRLAGAVGRIGRHLSSVESAALLNLRSAHRAVAGHSPGPEGSLAKLVIAENTHEAAAIARELDGPRALLLDGDGANAADLVLRHRAISIAGGTSEIKRNQIGERFLGLPRDPLVN